MSNINTEVCSLCQNPLSAFGSKPTKNGIICRDCAKKASPFLSDEEIKEKTNFRMQQHLNYRLKNLKKLERFKANLELDGKYRLCLDEKRNRFLFSKRKDLLQENPDILYFRQIQDVKVEEVLYPGSEEDYDVYLTLLLQGGALKRVRFSTNAFGAYKKDTAEYAQALSNAREIERILKEHINKEE